MNTPQHSPRRARPVTARRATPSNYNPANDRQRFYQRLKTALAGEFSYWSWQTAPEFVHAVMQAIDELYQEDRNK